MSSADDVVFFFDVDNTLFDNDRVHNDISGEFEREFGASSSDLYWSIFETLRNELGCADYLGALQRYRRKKPGGDSSDPQLLQISSFLLDYPFAARLYPGALDTLVHVRTWGPTVIVSDGDVVFQPRKIRLSGLSQAVEGRVLIYLHKELMIDDLLQRFPARHYVMVDDKLSILSAMKKILGDRLTTVFPRQGHYALDPRNLSAYPPADLAIEHIGDLPNYDFAALFGAAAPAAAQLETP